MNKLIKRSHLIKTSLSLFIFVLLHQYYIYYIEDFEIGQIVTHIENRPEWEILNKPSSKHLLHQTFTFLGMGDQSYAFLGEDKTTVLKLFKHHDKQGKRWLAPVFESCLLAFQELKEETGLIDLHLNKDTIPFIVTLIDKRGFRHKVDINATEYALQQKVDGLIFPTLVSSLKKKDLESIKNHIHAVFQLIKNRCDKGIGDRDTGLRRNYGFASAQPFIIDIGSFYRNEDLKNEDKANQEIALKTYRLYRWLKKHCPELLSFYASETRS